MIEINNNFRIEFTVVAITIMLCWFLSESAGHFCQPAEFEYVANTHFENLKHLKNPGHLSLNVPSMSIMIDPQFLWIYVLCLIRIMVA